MDRPRRLLPTSLVWILVLLLAPAPPALAQDATVVYLVRHAEKRADGSDPALTDAGRTRADLLSRTLADVPLEAVFSTDFARTRQTAAPVSEGHGLDVTIYDPGDPEALVRRLRDSAGSFLVVGHSNTIPDLVAKLGGDPGSAIDEAEYDRFYVVVLPGHGVAAVSALLRYGAPFHP